MIVKLVSAKVIVLPVGLPPVFTISPTLRREILDMDHGLIIPSLALPIPLG
jgi:hypothetical protein